MSSRAARIARCAVAATIAACVVGYGASSALAVIVHLKHGRALSYQPLRGGSTVKPFDTFFTNLDYSGGPVMASNTNYAIYWQPPGAPEYPAEYESGVNQYFKDLATDSGGHENTDSVATQYNDAAGEFADYSSLFGGAFIDKDPYPPNSCPEAAPICMDDEQLRSELVKFAKANGLPMDLKHEYFLLTPPGVEDCFEAKGFECSAGSAFPEYCAYHSAVAVEKGVLVYANDPYVTGNFGCDDGNHPTGKPSDGVIEGGLSHEHNESITDPEPNSGWTDLGEFLTGENGDKCRTGEEASEFGEPLGEVEVGGKKYKYNQEINGDKYWYQQEWSNKGHKCLQRLTFSASEAPTATFTSALLSGREVKFDATGSTSGSEEHYAWQFNDKEIPRTVETTELTINHLFSSAGVYNVALTVFKKDGASIGTAHNVVVGKTQEINFTSIPPTSAAVGGSTYTVSATGGGSGQPVTFAIDPAASTICSISGTTVSFTGVGTCVIDANQAGSALYNPAPQARQSFAVGPEAIQPGPPAPPVIPLAANGTVSAHAAINAATGEVTLTVSVANAGAFSWLAMFANGKFGVFSASVSKCKRGYVRLAGRCRPATIVFAKGKASASAAGTVTVTLKPSASARKALATARKRKKALVVTLELTFQSSLGGAPISSTITLTIRPPKK